MKTIIIIVGAARSGSTIVAKAIGGHSKCFTLGEINRFNEEINNPETHCGCAEKLTECDFWNTCIDEIKDETKVNVKGENGKFQIGIFNELTKNKKYKLIPTILFGKAYSNKNVNKKIKNTLVLYKALFKKTSSQVLVDSSKGLFRALVLATRSPKHIKFKFIHLVRDGRGVLNSSLKSTYNIKHKDNTIKTYEGIIDKNPRKIINSWLYINLRNFIILKLFRKNKTVFIRYEDFTSNPSKYLKQIYSSVTLDYEEKALDLGGNVNHILGGNSSRINAKKIQKQDDTWREKLNNDLLKKFNRKAGWFNRLIGYK